MNYEELMAWGEQYHYPSLVLSKRSYLRHGRSHYEALSTHPVRLRQAVKRIQRWNALMMRAQVESTMACVDNLLKNVDKQEIADILA